MSQNPIMYNPDLQGSCPLGGMWYTCRTQTPSFLGCCTTDPCNGTGCPSANLRAAGLGTGPGNNECVNDSSFAPNIVCPAGGQWYGCQTTPTFQGCCVGTSPCDLGSCSSENLRPASFANDFDEDKLILPCGMDMSTKTTETSSMTSSTSSTYIRTGTSMPTTASSSASSPDLTNLPTSTARAGKGTSPLIPAIAGSIGGILLLIILIFLLFFYRRRRKKSQSPRLPSSAISDFKAKEPLTPSTINTPGPPPYRHSGYPQSPNDIQRSEIHEIATSSTRYPEEVGDGKGLGITTAGSSSTLRALGRQGNGESEMLYTSWNNYKP